MGSGTERQTFIYDSEDILLELDGSNNITARYTHGPGIDEALMMEKGGASFFYHADGLGSITEITDSTGALRQQYTYPSFGKIESQLDPTFIQPYTFTSREFDSESGLYFYRARYYDPVTGRFLQEDPIGFLGGINFYTYVANNPIGHRDPSGKALIGVGVGVAFGFVAGISGALAQNASWPDIVVAGILGATAGGIIGALDPSEGFLTAALIGGGIGAIGNLTGQLVSLGRPQLIGEPQRDFAFDWGSFLGSALGSAIGAGLGQAVIGALARLGAPELLSSLGGGMAGLGPAALGGPLGSSLGRPTSGRQVTTSGSQAISCILR